MPLFSFENIFFTVGTGHKQKDILKGISHTVERGQVVAIIGPSGMYPIEKCKFKLFHVLVVTTNFYHEMLMFKL